ncbi:4-phosphoerythronate dehydrogenase [Candidatus Riesia pediculicola]|uniref:4-phosphoerythronate dehydrogenase n=1 Tax=Candidatus Riesia pediculicola TaxID=401619 RepID=UPI00178CECD6|nr:4-phosphoerythronate dehydrogenase [Candidatus Riesia pediculicola]QOJ86577.1 4-phosphoerythronate dehydrogenase [Candidatus Riesia pediculicola]
MLKILVDKNIPYALELFGKFGDVDFFDNHNVFEKLSKDVEILIVRSITKVNRSLIENTNIKFVGSVTSGTDHLDKKWMKKNGIFFCDAGGCNAISVVEYVISALLSQFDQKFFKLQGKTFGIIGFGKIGSLLKRYLKSFGVNTILYDPFRSVNEEKDKRTQCISLEDLIQKSDIISLHTSLETSSYHLFNENILDAVGTNKILINTSRGSVIDNRALSKLFRKGKKIKVILDVWENEPNISQYLFEKVMIGTPHIAGYSIESKIRGVTQIFKKLNKFLKKKSIEILEDRLFPKSKFKEIFFTGSIDEKNLKNLIHLVYNANDDSILWKRIYERNREISFEYIRNNYSIRREWSSIMVNCDDVNSFNLLKRIGFIVRYI